jgi:hypothetical protein
MSWRYPKDPETIPKAVRLRDEAQRLKGKADALQRKADALLAEADAVEESELRKPTAAKGKGSDINAKFRRRESKRGIFAARKTYQ